MEFLTPVLEHLRSLGDMRCTVFFGKHLPARLKRLQYIDNREPLSWEQFKEFTAHERFHIVLAPLPDTLFNRGRSISKLMDTVAVGGAGMFSARAPFSGTITHNHDGVLLGDDVTVWCAEIRRLTANLQAALLLAQRAVTTAERVGSRKNLRRFWAERLGLSIV